MALIRLKLEEKRGTMATAEGGGGPTGQGLWARTELPQPSSGLCWWSEGMPEGYVSKGLNTQHALPKYIYLLFYACGSGSQEKAVVCVCVRT